VESIIHLREEPVLQEICRRSAGTIPAMLDTRWITFLVAFENTLYLLSSSNWNCVKCNGTIEELITYRIQY
jgi:hypothetical protein